MRIKTGLGEDNMSREQHHRDLHGRQDQIRVLFVCLGNICRSPMAEAVFRDMVSREGLADRFVIDSAGLGSWHEGEPPHVGTRRQLDRAGISYEGIRARKIRPDDFEAFDYIVAMDEDNVRQLRRLGRESSDKVAKLLEFVPEASLRDVPDPYYTGNFDQTYELVTAGCRALLDRIKAEKLA